MRRLPVFLLLDVSESMVGKPLAEMEKAMAGIVNGLRQDPHALENVHLSVIAFAGKAATLAPLLDLVSFYPPKLPLGAGTALGAALTHLMDEIDRQVVKNTADRKGDWHPIVYLLTDGVPTDSTGAAVRRWKADYAGRATLVAITLGRNADSTLLNSFADATLVYEPQHSDDYLKFVRWMTQSMISQSRAVDQPPQGTTSRVSLEKPDPDILAMINDAAAFSPSDPYTVVLTGRCQRSKSPYLIKYQRPDEGLNFEHFSIAAPVYQLAGCFPLDEQYFEWSDTAGARESVRSDNLIGVPGCPHCGAATAFAMCSCGRLMCVNGPGEAQCPWCGEQCNFGESGGDAFDVQRSQG